MPRRPLYTYPAVYLPWALGFAAIAVWLATSMCRPGSPDSPGQDTSLTAAPVLVSTPPVPKAATPHLVFAYSVVRGGVHHAEDARRAVSADPLVARHYRDIALDDLRAIRTTTPRTAYVSYRIGDRIAWTRNPVVIPAGELLLTDGIHDIRARSGGRLSDTPVRPVADDEPATEVMDLVVASGETENGGGGSPLSGEGPPPSGVTSPGQTNPSSDLPPPIASGSLDPTPLLALPANRPPEGAVSSTRPPGPTGGPVPGSGGGPWGAPAGPSGGIPSAGSAGSAGPGNGSGNGPGGGTGESWSAPEGPGRTTEDTGGRAGGSSGADVIAGSGRSSAPGGRGPGGNGPSGGSSDEPRGGGSGIGGTPAGSNGTGTGTGGTPSGSTAADDTPDGDGGGDGSPGDGTQEIAPAGTSGGAGATGGSTAGAAPPDGAGDGRQPRLPGDDDDDDDVHVGTQSPPPRQVPEPATLYLVGAGLAAGLVWRRHVRRARRDRTAAAAQRDGAGLNDHE